MTVWRLDTGGAKAIRKDGQDVKQRYVGAIYHQVKAEEMQPKVLKEAYEELKEMYWRRKQQFKPAVIHVDETTPHLHLWILSRTGNLSAKDDRRIKRKCRTQEKFLEAMQERVPLR